MSSLNSTNSSIHQNPITFCYLSSLFGNITYGRVPVGASFTFTCSSGIGKTKIQCLATGEFSKNKSDLTKLCYWNLKNLQYFNNYVLQPFSVLILSACCILLKRSHVYNNRRQMRLYIYKWLLLSLNCCCTENFIFNVLFIIVQKHRLDHSFATRLCTIHILLSSYLQQAAYFWLFNVGFFLCWSILHPLKVWYFKMWHLHMVASVMPIFILGPYFLILGYAVEWKSFFFCYKPKKLQNYQYFIYIPSCILDLSGFLFLYLIIRRMSIHNVRNTDRAQSFISYYRYVKDAYKTEISIKKFFWLFLMLGQWRIINLVPDWALDPLSRINFLTIKELLVITSYCLITIPVCLNNPDVQIIGSIGSMAHQVSSCSWSKSLPKRQIERSKLTHVVADIYPVTIKSRCPGGSQSLC